MSYEATLSRVETYFDQTATRTWERLTSTAKVSRIRETVRRGRELMRARMLARLPHDLSGARILDAGCGAGQMTGELAARGADVLAVDISPSLVEIARQRLDPSMRSRVSFEVGDMLDPGLGRFDFALAMDSLIYYGEEDILNAVDGLGARCAGAFVFTVAPRTPALMAMWNVGRIFPRSDRSPVMVPHRPARLCEALGHRGRATDLGRTTSGFYISHAIEYRA
ncbi:magnesium protoporphyrin IX methyltransferase [Sulfitobacter sp. LCG007]